MTHSVSVKDRTPERVGDRGELRSRLRRLGVVHGRAEDDHSDAEEEHAQLKQTRLDGYRPIIRRT